ncbi:MAG: xanthine dehydrogenase accessory protein XdhC [Paracoccaceae bacterium]
MTFDLQSLTAAVEKHGTVTRIVVAQTQGSVPREVGAAMLVWAGGQSGTIGGGALEMQAAVRALSGTDWVKRIPLGPSLGQCCGGAVTLLAEVWNDERLDSIVEGFALRKISGNLEIPLKIQAAIRDFRQSGAIITPLHLNGWMLEAVSTPSRQFWIYGAGHVGRAMVSVLAPFPEMAITWVDTDTSRYPEQIPEQVSQLVAKNPADVVQFAPQGAEHLVLTFSHSLDLEICHQLLSHGFATAGLIGSKTKWVRFRRKLAALGHSQGQIARISCPIGQPDWGKHPQAIAVGVAADILKSANSVNISNIRVG